MSSQETKNCIIDAIVRNNQPDLAAVEMLGNCSVCFCGVFVSKQPLEQVGPCDNQLNIKYLLAPEKGRYEWSTSKATLKRC